MAHIEDPRINGVLDRFGGQLPSQGFQIDEELEAGLDLAEFDDLMTQAVERIQGGKGSLNSENATDAQ